MACTTAAYAKDKPLAHWHDRSVQVAIDPSLDLIGPFAAESVLQATKAWQEAGHSVPSVSVAIAAADEIGYFAGRQNKNTVRFAQAGEPLAKGALAITVVTTDAATGRILDADIIVNGVYPFGDVKEAQTAPGDSHPDPLHRNEAGKSRDGEASPGGHAAPKANAYDLQSVLTHEVGHFLGLKDDVADPEATMYVYSSPGETQKRSLSPADHDALENLYVTELGSASEADTKAIDTGAGCGGASITGRAASDGQWLLPLAALGLTAFGTRRARGSTKRLGVGVGLGFCTLTAVSALQAGERDGRAIESGTFSAEATVARVASSWHGGLILSEVELSPADCGATGECGRLPTRVTLAGGQIGSIVQHVGHASTPSVGQRVVVRAVWDRKKPTADVFSVRAKLP